MSRDPEIAQLTTQVHAVVTKAYVLSLKLVDTLTTLTAFEPRFTELAERRHGPTVWREEERRHD